MSYVKWALLTLGLFAIVVFISVAYKQKDCLIEFMENVTIARSAASSNSRAQTVPPVNGGGNYVEYDEVYGGPHFPSRKENVDDGNNKVLDYEPFPYTRIF